MTATLGRTRQAGADPTGARPGLVERLRVPPRAVLGVALAAALALRTVGLGTVGLNSDEAVYASQSASLAGNRHFTGLFPVVRAHPLLLQALMSPLYRHGQPDTVGRYVTALFGVGTVVLVYLTGRALYDARVGSVAALLLAVMPYHVTIGRQILLDGPMAFFTTAALLCLARSERSGHREWLVAAGACLGLAAVSKETAVIMVGAAFAFLALRGGRWRPVREPALGLGLALGIAWSYPVLTALSGGARSGQSYLMWQLTRQPNHTFGFYIERVGAAMGPVLLGVAVLGLVSARVSGRRVGPQETLLLCWAGVPFLFFEVWPVKGFSYLTGVAPVVALLGARALVPPATGGRTGIARRLAAVAVVATLVVPAVRDVSSPAGSGLAGAGGLPGGREAGRWIAGHTPVGARFMTIGPSMANLIQYYGGRPGDGLSVSPNPLHRNPSYYPIGNADADLRSGTYQYVVWDVYSAGRSPQFAARLTTLVRRYHGRIVHVEYGRHAHRSGVPLVVVYEVTP